MPLIAPIGHLKKGSRGKIVKPIFDILNAHVSRSKCSSKVKKQAVCVKDRLNASPWRIENSSRNPYSLDSEVVWILWRFWSNLPILFEFSRVTSWKKLAIFFTYQVMWLIWSLTYQWYFLHIRHTACQNQGIWELFKIRVWFHH